jgi:MATE family multidrug resistance protein
VPEPLIGIFVDADSPVRADVVVLGVSLLAMAALFQLVDAAQVMALGLLRGIQDTAVPMMIAAVSYWVIGIPTGYLMAFTLGWGPQGLWLGLVVGLAFAAVALTSRFWRRRLKHPMVSGTAA